jgi:hypothetical protein
LGKVGGDDGVVDVVEGCREGVSLTDTLMDWDGGGVIVVGSEAGVYGFVQGDGIGREANAFEGAP